jgi:serine/threonine protein kinase
LKQYKSYTIDGLVNSLRAHYIASNKYEPNPKIICIYAIICSDDIKSRIRTPTDTIPENFFCRRTEPLPSEDETYCYALFEYIDGVSIDAYKNMESEVIPLTRQLFDAVHYLHTIGIAHRDIKPGNVMITRDGRLKLIDLGSACFIGRCGKGASTKEYTMSKYYSYTNTRSQNDFAFNNDIYACLLTVYYMLSSSNKFSAHGLWPQNDNAEFMKIPSQYRALLSKYIDEISGKSAEPIVDIAQCKAFMDRFLSDLSNVEVRPLAMGGRLKSKTRRYKKRGNATRAKVNRYKKKTRVMRGGANELIDTVLSKDHKNVEWALIDLIEKNDGNIGTPSDPLVDRIRSTSGKTPLFFTIRNKSSSTFGFGGSSNCSGKYINVLEGPNKHRTTTLVFPQFNQDTYILLRLLGARIEHRDAKGKGILESDGCEYFKSHINIAEGKLQKMAILYNQMGSVTAAVQHPSFAPLKSLLTGLRGKRVDSGFLNNSLKNMLDSLYRSAV